ncbi:hypothetical protein NEMIN01_0287 [Nematocida minor]|uniref:uncharacterized protein n=1 Tax=Nematocida minor TaxID=1912983 RepID=UPI0022210FE6|nr:uncharacterized protein NEMIN01_0287 [Nematocida minor]KAI5189121.1 hypothetical protein NEMIN01_0287 [Nematocida minor]
MAYKGRGQKKGGKDAYKNRRNERSEKKERSEHYAPKYIRGEKQMARPKPRLTRNVVNKTFKTDSELTEFILSEGTFKDRITALALVIIKDQDGRALNQLLDLAETENGGDKSYLAITHAVKILEYYKECKSESEKRKEPADENEENDENENKQESVDSSEFCAFIEKTAFIKRVPEVIARQMGSSFLKGKLTILIKSMIEADTLSGQMLDILMDAADVEIDREIMVIFGHITRTRNYKLIHILRDKIVQTILYHKNLKKVKYFVTLALAINRTEWILESADYKVYIEPLIKGFLSVLKKVYEEIDNPKLKNKAGTSVLSSVLKGLLRFINWQKTVPSLEKNYTTEIFKDFGYIIFKLAYNENTKYSLPALNILEVANETEKINYARVLGDTIRKYIYLNDLSRCEILNKAVNVPGKEVQSKVVHSAYHTPIGSKYPLGCQMVSQEAGADFSEKMGYVLLCKSHDKEVAQAAKKIVAGESIPVYNIWS